MRLLRHTRTNAHAQGETTQLQHFAEDAAAAPRYLSLVFQQPKVLLSQLRADGLASLLSAVRCAAPGCTLGLLLLGVRGALAAGGAAAAGWEAREADAALLRLTLTTPGLQLRLLEGAEDAALHLAHTVRVCHQPHCLASIRACACVCMPDSIMCGCSRCWLSCGAVQPPPADWRSKQAELHSVVRLDRSYLAT
jgi:hypothetical protein